MASTPNSTTFAPGSAVPAATPLPVDTVGTVGPTTRAMPVVATAPSAGAVPAAALVGISLLVILIGAWAAIIPFVGHLFGFSADGTPAWYWSLRHALLWLAPGALAFVIGLAMLAQARRAEIGLSRVGSVWMGFLTAVAGAWLVVGPLAWPVLENGGKVFRTAGPLRELLYQVGWSLGPGLLLVLLGGCTMGLAFRRRNRVTTNATPVLPTQVPV